MTEEDSIDTADSEKEQALNAALDSSDANPKSMLVAWANQQDGWVRTAIGQVIESGRELSETQLSALVDQFLVEKGFDDQRKAEEIPPLPEPESDVSTEDVLELKQLAGIRGVNALAEDQVLEFDPSLTILFGQNGAGKTGYSRVLKRLAAVRTAEEILPNAHSTEVSETPSALISYELNGTADLLSWSNEVGVSPFTRMSVFDAPAVNLHVDDELNYVFTPREIALFGHASTAIRHVQETVEIEARGLRLAGNPFIGRFQRGTAVYAKLETLGTSTDLAELSKLKDDSEEGAAKHEKLGEEVAALKSGNVEARHETVRRELERVRMLEQMAKAIAEFDPGVYEANRVTLRRLEAEYRKARTELFEADELHAEPDDEWNDFISAADEYRSHLGLHEYPEVGNDCIYCGQPLGEAALKLVAKYRTYLDDALSRQVDEAQKALAVSKLTLGDLSIDVLREHVRQVVEAEPVPAYAAGLDDLFKNLETAISASEEAEPVPKAPEMGAQTKAAIKAFSVAIPVLDAALADLSKQKDDRVQALATKERELNELTARRKLAEEYGAISSAVEDAKRGARLEALTKSMSNTLQPSLTRLSKQASEDLVNKNFEQLFEEECQALNAPSVALEFQGRRGKAERKKVVAKYRPSDVLSEGEQKVLAIADFLAESRMAGVKAPIVFDDPVTSLDYLRLNEVAERISRLAETHQVVVFTHNIFFASTLLGLRTTKKLRSKFYEVKSTESQKGVLQADVEPRQDTPAEIGKRINKTVESAESADATIKEALVERAYGLLRAWCEAFVEQELLANVTQRHRSNLMMGGLDRIKLDRFEKAKSVLTPLFDRCSRFMPGHSQSAEQLNIRPSLEDFAKDWTAAQEVRKEYIA
jgi:hypothetical protein